jgi:hypothetical protein
MAKMQLLFKWPAGLLVGEDSTESPWVMFWFGWFWSAILTVNLMAWLGEHWRDQRIVVVVALGAAVLPSFLGWFGLKKPT